ncbi:MAG: transglutaminase-like domain-containing protein [Bacteroidetes bacterium]|nr:transglutaminase-like domain-containing protein [Bacteroidota bacterium]
MEDPDEIVYAHVRDKLLNYGPEAIPFLELEWEDYEMGILFQKRIEDIIHDIQFEDVKSNLIEWIKGDDKDLLTGCLIMAKFQYPGLDEKLIRADLAQIKQDIWLEISQKNTILEKIRIFNKVFFGHHHFRGNTENYLSPLNSYINTVLEMRRGNPLSLSIVYSLLAQSLGMPIYGVNLPNHFVLAYMDDENVAQYQDEPNKYGVLFYINPFSKGSLFDESGINTFLKSYNIPPQRAYFEPCSNTTIMRRMITNLISSFQEVGNSLKVNELTILRDVLE